MELEQVRQGQEEKGQKHPPHNPLLSPYKMGNFQLSHRVVLVPLTRQRSFDNIPQPHAALNYSQRTSKGGLLIAEATMVSDTAQGYPFTPGILTKEQVEAWKPIVDVVHAKSGIFFCQIWHAERVSNQGYGRENGMRAVVENHTDLVAYGRFFLANPDLPRRFELNASLNKYNRETFYTHDPVVGYIDYPFLEEINA